MAIGRISGAMLKANLERLGTDIAFETDLLYIDVANDRIGINTSSPSQSLQVDNVTINNSQIRSTSGKLDLGTTPSEIYIGGGGSNQVLTTDGSGNLSWQSVSGGGLVTGRDVTLSYPDDSSLYPTGAINDWEFSTNVTTAIDDLNELSQNVINNTAVANVDFTANATTGAQGLVVTLTITADGNPNRYTIEWGDGNTTTATTDSTPTHTYNTNVGSPFSVKVTAFNNSGVGKGSSVSKTRTDYITIYGPTPVVTFAAYAASSGGSPITQWDDGDTIYFENTTTNTSGATVQYTWAWGDGSSNDVISSDSSAGGVGGGRLAHTFTTSTEQEQSRTVTLTLDAHNVALPSDIPTDDSNTYKIYDTHTPEVSLDDNSGVNELATSGHRVTFTNNTESTIGNYSTYGIQYRYNFGDGDTQTVNVGTGASGDTGGTIQHTYSLSSSDQNAGNSQDYTGNLQVLSSHTGSPFATTDFTVHVEPDMRANYTASAVTTSDRTGDNQYDLYDHTDLNGNNRALVTLSNSTLPNVTGANYTIDWGDSSTDDTPTEDGSTPGTIGNAITHNYAGTGTGNKTVSLTVSATPDITAQTDTDNDLTFTINAVPSAPAGVSSKTLSMSTASTGTSPYLAAGYTDNSGGNGPAAGGSVTRYTGSGTVSSQVINDAYNSHTGQIITAKVNGSDSGSKTFTSSDGETGTFTSLVVTSEGDAHDEISSSTYPSHFYKVFTARIDHSLGSLSNGYSDFQLSHNNTGDTNRVGFVKDDLTTTPVVDLSSATLTQNNAGSVRYISGIPYYNTGSPTLTLAGAELYQWIGQTYRNTTQPFEIASGTNDESTSSSVISTQYKNYATLDGASTYLTSGVPNANTGKTSGTKYAIGDQSIAITSSSVAAVETIKFRATNVNGTGSYAELTGTKIQVHTATPSGIQEDAIAVPDSLGNGTYTDDGVRISGFGTSTDTPTFNSATNYYTSNAWSGAVTVAGTSEAITRWGTIKHFTTDLSSGYLPAGPDLNTGRSGSQYYTFAFRRQVVANIDINITAPGGIEGCWIALPGTNIDNSSGLNGWLECTSQYNGVGLPGSDTGNGGNGADGCAYTGSDVIPVNTAISGGSYQMTLGTENMSNATGNVMLVRIKLGSGDTITSLSIGVA